MARVSLYLVFGLVLGAMLVNVVSQDPGYLLITWGDWQVETSVWLALSVMIIVLLFTWLVVKALSTTLRVPRVLRLWLGLRSARGAQRRANKGFAAFFEGRWDVAEQALGKVGFDDEQTLLHPLYAALAALRLGESGRALSLLEQAEKEGSVRASLILMVRVECYLDTGSAREAEHFLEQLPASDRKMPRAMALQAKLAYLQQDWQKLMEVLPDVQRARTASEEQVKVWEREVWLGLLSEAGDSSSKAVSVWKRAPDSLKSPRQPLWDLLLDVLQHNPEWDVLQKLLQERLRQYCEPVTLDAVSRLPDRQLLKMKKFIQQWCNEDSEGRCHAALARIARIERDAESETALWKEACARHASASHAAGWAACLRNQGKELEALALEADALSALR